METKENEVLNDLSNIFYLINTVNQITNSCLRHMEYEPKDRVLFFKLGRLFENIGHLSQATETFTKKNFEDDAEDAERHGRPEKG